MNVTHSAPLLEHESIANDSPHTHSAWNCPDAAHQGDLIFVAISSLPKSAKTRKNRQLADGNTQGSRHILSGGKCYDCDAQEVAGLILATTKIAVEAKYIGPVFTTPCEVTHPEHGNHIWPKQIGKHVIATVFQRSLDAEEREQRVID